MLKKSQLRKSLHGAGSATSITNTADQTGFAGQVVYSPHFAQCTTKPGCEPLDQQALERALTGKISKVVVEQSLPSTNIAARNIAFGDLPCLIACEEQTAGRGRHKHTWVSEPGQSLTFTLALPLGRSSAAGLSLAVAVGVAKCLESLGCAARLKWPNDLLATDGGKLGGILIETISHPAIALVGVGLNLLPSTRFHEQLPSASCVFSDSNAVERNEVLTTMTIAILDKINLWQMHGFGACRDAWSKLCSYASGEKISVTTSTGSEILEFVGVDDAGQLLGVDAAGQLREVPSGEVSDVASD